MTGFISRWRWTITMALVTAAAAAMAALGWWIGWAILLVEASAFVTAWNRRPR